MTAATLEEYRGVSNRAGAAMHTTQHSTAGRDDTENAFETARAELRGNR
jgi:hypothetical protein